MWKSTTTISLLLIATLFVDVSTKNLYSSYQKDLVKANPVGVIYLIQLLSPASQPLQGYIEDVGESINQNIAIPEREAVPYNANSLTQENTADLQKNTDDTAVDKDRIKRSPGRFGGCSKCGGGGGGGGHHRPGGGGGYGGGGGGSWSQSSAQASSGGWGGGYGKGK